MEIQNYILELELSFSTLESSYTEFNNAILMDFNFGQVIKGKDGDTPYIGENGNWWIGGVDTGQFAGGSGGGGTILTTNGVYVPTWETNVKADVTYVDETLGNINAILETI